jgi:glycosyltransferase involved in cell wall biosynthesis
MEPPLRILHVTPYFAPAFRYGGPPRSVLGLCRALGQAGIEVEVLTTAADGPFELPPSPPEGEIYEGVAVRYLPRAFPRRLFGARGLGAALDAAIARSDLVHVHGLWNAPGWAAGRAARRARVPLVISPRGMLDPGSIAQRAWRKRFAYGLVERRSLLDAAFLHATSRAEARAVRAWAPGAPVVTLPNGVEAPPVPASAAAELRRRLGVPDGSPIVAFLGRIHPIKRLDLLAEAFERVLAARPESRLVIAGPDERGHRREMEPRFAQRVHWAGQLGEDDKWALLSASSLLVLCSDSESFGLSVAEAMAAGVPVVATRTCPWEEIESAGAGFWVAQEPEAIAEGMRALLADPARARAMGERGRALVGRRYAWDAVASDMAEWYRAAVHHAPSVVVTPGLTGMDGVAAMSRQVARALAPVRVLALHDKISASAHAGQGIGLCGAGGSKLGLAALTARMLRRGRAPAQVVCLHLHLGPVARLLAWWRRAKLVTVLVGIECWRPLRRLERAAFQGAYRVLAISQHTITRFRQANPGLASREITVCHLAVPPLERSFAPSEGEGRSSSRDAADEPAARRAARGGLNSSSGDAALSDEARGRSESREAPGFALIVGRMAASERYKGHDLLIDVWPRLLAEVPDARLVVAGAGDDRARLEARAASLGSSIRFVGPVTEAGLDALYRDCAFFVMPSTEEGFGIVFLEAMRAGRACVGAVGSASELIEDGVSGYVVDPSDPEALLKALVRLVQDPVRARRMGEAGRARYEREFNEEAFTARLLASLDETLR